MIREPEDLLALLSDAVGNALNNLEAVEFGYGSGSEKRIAVNRAIKMQDGSGWAMRQVKNGTRERNRTSDQKFRKLLLYPLSYPGASFLFETVS